MSSSTSLNILFTGGSGYIGGAVLERLLAHPRFEFFNMIALIRAQEKAAALQSVGVTPVVGTYQDYALLEKLASEADYAITVADCDDVPANAALLRGFKKRFDATGIKPTLIHTSGTGMLSDDAFGAHASDTIYYDNDPDQIETLRPTQPHRPVDLDIVKAAAEGYVETHIVAPGAVYGIAHGKLADLGVQRRLTILTPFLVKGALERGSVLCPGQGKNIWPFVHLDECADIYMTIFNDLLEGKTLPNGREGYYFAESSEITLYEYTKIIAEALKDLGKLPTDELTECTAEERTPFLETIGGNSRCRAERARSLGWKPKYGAADLVRITKEEVIECLKGL